MFKSWSAKFWEELMNSSENLIGYVIIMKEKLRPSGEPGYLHYRVYADYVRRAMAGLTATEATAIYLQLGLPAGERSLLLLELECIEYALKFHPGLTSSIDLWLKLAIERTLSGKKLTLMEVLQFEDILPGSLAA